MRLLQLSIIRKTLPLSLSLILVSISSCLVPPILLPFFQNIHNFITIIHRVFFCSCNFKLSYSLVNKISDRQTTSASIRQLLVKSTQELHIQTRKNENLMTPLTDDLGLRVTGYTLWMCHSLNGVTGYTLWMCHSLNGTDGMLLQAKMQEHAQYMPI